MKTIKFTQDKVALVDDEDFDYLSQFIGLFKLKEEAARAYNEVALRMYGGFAKLNQIKERE